MLICFEGPEFNGKSTQAKLLYERLLTYTSHPVISVVDPGSTALGQTLRGIVKETTGIHPVAHMLLFSAARIRMQPELQLESLAAQLHGQAALKWPDVTFVLTVPVDATMNTLFQLLTALKLTATAHLKLCTR
jgi:hypothetical protein